VPVPRQPRDAVAGALQRQLEQIDHRLLIFRDHHNSGLVSVPFPSGKIDSKLRALSPVPA